MALASRTDLQDYCLRRLGHPVIEINVDDAQLSDRIDDSLQFFQEYHFDGVEKTFVKHQITGSKLKLTANLGGNFTKGSLFRWGLVSGLYLPKTTDISGISAWGGNTWDDGKLQSFGFSKSMGAVGNNNNGDIKKEKLKTENQ